MSVFREVILEMLERGLDSQRIFQDLQSDMATRESTGRYIDLSDRWERSTTSLSTHGGRSRIRTAVDFGAGKPCKDHTGAMRKNLHLSSRP